MHAFTDKNVDPQGIGVWAVKGEIFGEIATIFTGNLWKCCEFVANNTEKSEK